MNEVSGRDNEFEPKPHRFLEDNINCAHIQGGNISVSREEASQNYTITDIFCQNCNACQTRL